MTRAALRSRQERLNAVLREKGLPVPTRVPAMVRLLSCRYARNGVTVVEVPEARLWSTRAKAVRLGFISDDGVLSESGKDFLRAAGVTP